VTGVASNSSPDSSLDGLPRGSLGTRRRGAGRSRKIAGSSALTCSDVEFFEARQPANPCCWPLAPRDVP
jgi:hypothetical protein